MAYRTRTYIAGDWTGDKNAIDQLYKWNDGDWSLSFVDAHELTQARDDSLNCSIKKSLKERMDISKTFVLIVGEETNNLTKGGCQLCTSYNSWSKFCVRGHTIDYRSYIKYECHIAAEAKINIIVLYNSTIINRNKCPEEVRNLGLHIPMMKRDVYGTLRWNYNEIRDAINTEDKVGMYA